MQLKVKEHKNKSWTDPFLRDHSCYKDSAAAAK